MRKVLKATLFIFCSIIFLLLGFIVYLNTPWGQNLVRGRAEAFLQKRLNTVVHIGHLGYGLPKYVVLDDVLFLDEVKDTLLSAKKLKIDLNMMKLIHKNVDVQALVFNGVISHIYRNKQDTTYNFTYIINAFAGNQPKDPAKAKDTTASALHFNLDRVKFEDIHFRFDDYAGGTRFGVALEHLDIRVKDMDLDQMLFHIKQLTVEGLQTSFSQDTSYLPIEPETNGKTKFTLIADDINLQRIGFQYNDALNKFLFSLNLGDMRMQLNKFGLEDNIIDVKKLVMANTDIVLSMGASSTTPAFVDTLIKKDTMEGWHINAGDINIAGASFKMDNNSVSRIPYGMDYAHLYFQHTDLDLHDFLYTSDTISGDVKHFVGTEQCGLNVKELRTIFHYDPQGAVLANLYLQTPTTTLQNHVEVHYPSLKVLQTNTQSLQLNLNVKNSIVGLHDIFLFVPQLKDQEMFRKLKDNRFNLESVITGSLGNMNVAHFYLSGLSNTQILLNGRLSGLPEPKNISYNFHVSSFVSSRKDVSLFVSDTLLSSVRIPNRFGIMGEVSGTALDYSTDVVLVSTDGRAYVKGTLAMSAGKGKERYDMFVKTDALNIGHILKRDSLMGEVSASIVVKGESFDTKIMNAFADAEVSGAEVKGYNYHDLKLHGKVAAQTGNIIFSSADSNLRIKLNAQADFSGKYMALKADLNMDSVDFHALHLYSTELRTRGIIHADFPELNPDYPRGEFVWRQPVVTTNGRRYYIDSMYVISRPSADTGQNIIADLEVMQATITGKTPLTKIAGIVQDHISRHYTFPVNDSAKNAAIAAKHDNSQSIGGVSSVKIKDTSIPASYNLKLVAHIIDKPLLHSLLPGLTSFDSVHVDGTLTPRNLSLNVAIPNLVYGTNMIQNGTIQIRGADSAFTYKINADEVSSGAFKLWYADIHGNLDQNTITTNISLSDNAKKEEFALSASMQRSGDTQIVKLQKGLKLYYDAWDVAESNRIVFVNGGFYVNNFEISSKGQFLKANSAQSAVNTPLKIDIGNFLLANITGVMSKGDSLLINGVLGGSVTIQRMSPALQLTSDLSIQGLSVLRDTLGDLNAQITNPSDNVLDAKITLNGQGNDIVLNGSYYLQTVDGNDFKFDLDVNALSVRTFETIAQNQIKNSSGYVRGNLKISGTPTAPLFAGSLHTDNLTTTISQLNAAFKMPAEKIVFSDNTITFDHFTLHDSADNKAVFTGRIYTADLPNLELDMKVKASNWRAVHSRVTDNKNFYGDLLLTTDLNIQGTASAPSVDGYLKILKGTDFTVVTPESNPEIQSTKGIVVFVNMKDTSRRNVLKPRKRDSVVKRKFAAGSDINVNITVDKSAQFSLIIDQSSGDFLSVKGEASLNAAVTPGGVVTLSGNYDIHSGAYQLNYNFIKRKFSIKDGSTITFTGDPLKGTMLDVTAVYEANVAPYDLVQREVPDPAQLNYFKQNLPFNVDLHLKGAMLKPGITFYVILPENKVYPLSADQIELIQGKLSQVRMDTSELNKQVFAVLILSRFVADDPFNSGTATSVAFTALQSVSTFIGEQLNQLAGKLVKGIDITADVQTKEDYTTGDLRQRTDLNLAASKTLLDDRLKLTIGNDFELEGPQTANNGQSNLVPSNLAADYLLSADGRYTVRAYRKNYDEGVLQGFVTETGLNFIVSLDYNHFKNVLKKRKKVRSDSTALK